MGGRTGGPLTPILAMASQLPYTPIVIEVPGGYGDTLGRHKGLKVLHLPQTKLSSLSFGLSLAALIEVPIQFLRLLYATCLSMYYLLKFKPIGVLGAGGFTTVPMAIALRILRLIGLPTKLVVHQQDPLIGLANKISLRLADKGTYVWDCSSSISYTKKLRKIPNPIEFEKFNPEVISRLANKFPELNSFITSSDKPILLVFGGGSGAKSINEWVVRSIDDLADTFRIIHLSGVLQEYSLPEIDSQNYFRMEYAIEEMPLLLVKSDLVLCRAGLGSISELLYLNKPAVLVPIPNSHQEINAQVAKDYFAIYEQEKNDDWTTTLSTSYPQFFHTLSHLDPVTYREQLCNFYFDLEQFLEK